MLSLAHRQWLDLAFDRWGKGQREVIETKDPLTGWTIPFATRLAGNARVSIDRLNLSEQTFQTRLTTVSHPKSLFNHIEPLCQLGRQSLK